MKTPSTSVEVEILFLPILNARNCYINYLRADQDPPRCRKSSNGIELSVKTFTA